MAKDLQSVAIEKTPVATSKNVAKVKFKPTTKLPEAVFGLEQVSSQAIFDAIIAERASRRQGTHKVKTRGEVSGTGKKPWAQKGTGKARTASLRTPVFVGGGRAFGPTVERNYTIKINKKVRRLALFSALTELAKAEAILVKEIKVSKISTKELVSQLQEEQIASLRHVLLVTSDENTFKSAKNLKNVITTKVNSLSVEDLVLADVLVISESDIKVLEGLVK
ncbi:50S ribosomal protein L4 [Mycoplasma iguanae]|uniref:Large ribosomal subunit protein uL4 n=1 Tax=Mycoplasma iguanae TaxID=292461 RepID=A0ABY5R8K7_9MOLU|nr:50S ribosomal protein L4 [Mycoplasma iguanae]UVD81779.1 50S ribosomal protein L4 [Mycoplasma iguanae]